MDTVPPGAELMGAVFVQRKPSCGTPSLRTIERKVFLIILKPVFMADPSVESRYILYPKRRRPYPGFVAATFTLRYEQFCT